MAAVFLAVASAGCALLDGGSETADCETVQVAFEDALGHVRGSGAGATEQDGVEYGEAGLRDAVQMHDARQECFGREHRDFLDPARAQFDDEDDEPIDFLAPVQDQAPPAQPPMLGDGPGTAGD